MDGQEEFDVFMSEHLMSLDAEHVAKIVWQAAYAKGAEAGAKAKREVQTKAAADVLEERQRQIEKEGWTAQHDDEHYLGDIALAAGSYAVNAGAALHFNGGDTSLVSDSPPYTWPWDSDWWKPSNSRRDLVKAGALILAEIERLDRVADELKGDHGYT